MRWLLALLMLSVPGLLLANSIDLAGVSVSFEEATREETSKTIQIFVLLTVLSLAPAIMIMLTAFTRIIIVLAMLRHAFGMQQTPPNIVLVSLALFLTLFTMMPVIEEIDRSAYAPYMDGQMTFDSALASAERPLKEFMVRQTREQDLVAILEMSGEAVPESIDDVRLPALIPAFMLSELQTAFQIGFVVFLPFLVVDLVVASVLMAMGMIMVPPLTISLPVKVLMFVLIDGWLLIAQALVGSFF